MERARRAWTVRGRRQVVGDMNVSTRPSRMRIELSCMRARRPIAGVLGCMAERQNSARLIIIQLLLLPSSLLALIMTFPLVHAQYPPPASFQNILKSPVDSNVTVAYKQPDAGTCMTAFTTQKQYTGYIGLPPYTLAPIQQDYSINTFFWFIEARQTPQSAPLTIYLNGGPGSSSMFGLFNEVGPCEVVQTKDGSYGTQMRAFGWDRATNILFIDQPNQVGFSYDSAINASMNLLTNEIFEPPTPDQELPNFMYLDGTFGTANENNQGMYAATANTTQIAAAATWHFLQTWLSTFSQYNPATRPNASTSSPNETVGVNLFAESYGGKYGPAFATYFEQQNLAITNGQITSNNTLQIKLQSLGIVNGLVDDLIQDYYYPFFAYNNTYGVEIITQTEELNSINQYTNLCLPAIQVCRSANPDVYGDDANANNLCERAQETCNILPALAGASGYFPYDIRQKIPSPDPPAAYQEYLNQETVQAAIGARVNYTESSPYVQKSFISTGDTIRGGMIQDLANLLKLGVRVALIYGDADYLCNWYGGQAVAFAVANALPDFPIGAGVSFAGASTQQTYADGFASAGYADIVVNDTYVGGAVRQYGNLSFSRIYDAGHFIPYYQPETLFQVFARVALGNDISTGVDADLSTFMSNGTANATHINNVPSAPSGTCWVRNWNGSCSADDTSSMIAGKGLVSHGIFYQDSSSIVLPSTSVPVGMPGAPMTSTSSRKGTARSSMTSTVPLTGLYTATGTPSSSSGKGAASMQLRPLGICIEPIVVVILSVFCGIASILL